MQHVKCVIVGDAWVGKSAMVAAYAGKEWPEGGTVSSLPHHPHPHPLISPREPFQRSLTNVITGKGLGSRLLPRPVHCKNRNVVLRTLLCELHICTPLHTSLPLTTQLQPFLIMWPQHNPKQLSS